MVKIFYCINLKAIAAFLVSVFYNVLFIDGNASESSLFFIFFDLSVEDFAYGPSYHREPETFH